MAERAPITLLEATADTVGTAYNVQGTLLQIVCENIAGDGDADYGGGTVTLQTSHEGGGWQNVADTSGALLEINAGSDFAATIRLTGLIQVRARIDGATNPDVSVKLV
jgi:hypothetical protein